MLLPKVVSHLMDPHRSKVEAAWEKSGQKQRLLHKLGKALKMWIAESLNHLSIGHFKNSHLIKKKIIEKMRSLDNKGKRTDREWDLRILHLQPEVHRQPELRHQRPSKEKSGFVQMYKLKARHKNQSSIKLSFKLDLKHKSVKIYTFWEILRN
jgi:hypothetical protein